VVSPCSDGGDSASKKEKKNVKREETTGPALFYPEEIRDKRKSEAEQPKKKKIGGQGKTNRMLEVFRRGKGKARCWRKKIEPDEKKRKEKSQRSNQRKAEISIRGRTPGTKDGNCPNGRELREDTKAKKKIIWGKVGGQLIIEAAIITTNKLNGSGRNLVKPRKPRKVLSELCANQEEFSQPVYISSRRRDDSSV